MLSPLATYMTGRPGFKRGSIEHILSQGFDVIHWHNLSLVGGPAALQCGTAVKLCTLHDYWLMCPTSILFRYNREVCAERTCIRCSLVYKRPPQLWRAGDLLKSSLLHVDRFLAPSRFVRDIFRKSDLGIDATLLPHFVPPVTGIRAGSTAADRSYYLVASRLEKAKGIQTILPLFRETNRKLLIAGAGNYDRELRWQAGNCSQIEFLGRIPREQLGEVYAGARATIVPSICQETFGLTILESLQHGTPVIVSGFGALPEVLADTEGGVVYRDIPALESILQKFDRDSEYARALGLTGQARLHKYTAEAHLLEYMRIVEEERSRR
jgi:glycosyltransferase involved in cell wall biosynthesis